jgi:hypothetical protein
MRNISKVLVSFTPQVNVLFPILIFIQQALTTYSLFTSLYNENKVGNSDCVKALCFRSI